MYPYESIIWQPTNLYQPHYDFGILLDRKFAVEMVKTTLISEEQNRMNRLGAEIAERFKYRSSSPYIFHEDSAFVRQINLDGGRGTWLAIEGLHGKAPDLSSEKPLKYSTHNMDVSSDVLCLLSLFDQWIYYSNVLRNPLP